MEKNHYPYIYIFKGNIPWFLSYHNTRMTDYEDKDYYYNSSERKLYINGNCNIDSLLYEIAIEGNLISIKMITEYFVSKEKLA